MEQEKQEVKRMFVAMEGETPRVIEPEKIELVLNGLRQNLQDARKCKSYIDGDCMLNYGYLMADILDVLHMKNFLNLSIILGREQAAMIWPEVENSTSLRALMTEEETPILYVPELD